MKRLRTAIKALMPIVYVKTFDEYGTFKWLEALFKREVERPRGPKFQVFHPILGGFHTFEEYAKVSKSFKLAEGIDLPAQLKRMLEDNPQDQESFFIFFEADEYLWDPEFQQALRLIQMQRETWDSRLIKQVILVGSKGEVPDRLKPYVAVLDETVLTFEAITAKVERLNKEVARPEFLFVPESFVGAKSSVEIDNAGFYALLRERNDKLESKPAMTPAEYVAEFKREFP